MILRKRPAYTLLELALVVTIIALLAGLAIPSLNSMYHDLKLGSGTDQVRTAWTLARVQAMNEGRTYRFAIVPGKGNYRLAPDSGEFWSDGGIAPGDTDDPDQPIVLQDALPPGVRFALDEPANPADFDSNDTVMPPDSVDPGQYIAVARFLPDGTCREDVTITFTLQGAQPVGMKLRGLTGIITVKALEEGVEP